MTVREILMLPYERYEQGVAALKSFLDRRTQRERFWIVVVMFVLFAAAAVWQFIYAWTSENTITHIQSLKY